MNLKVVAAIAGAVVVFGIGLALGHGTRQKAIPKIVTKYDTVTVTQFAHDTAFLSKVRRDTVHDTVNLTEYVETTKVDTVKVFYPLSGILGLTVGQKFGDTTKVVTFTLTPFDSVSNRFDLRSHLYGFYTPGPLAAAVMTSNGQPKLQFYDPPRECHESRAFLTGAGTATGVIAGAKLVLNLFAH